jgi:hypothetical protein
MIAQLFKPDKRKMSAARFSVLQQEASNSEISSSTEKPRKRRRQHGAPQWSQLPRKLEVATVDVAPAPRLATLEGRDQGVAGGVEMLKRMRMRRILTAPDMAA